MKEKNFISAVIYIRNDEKNIVKFADVLNQSLQDHFVKYEMIFVNDCSTDKSSKVIREWSKNVRGGGNCSIINMSFYQGKELSMSAGVDLAIGDFVYEFDTINLDYSSKLIFDIYEKSLEGYDIVSASPKGKRKLSSKLFYKLFNHFSYSQNKIDTETFRILSRRAINRMNSLNKTVPYRKAIEASCGLSKETIYYDITTEYKARMDKNLRKEREKNAFDALILFTDVSYKASIVLTILMFLFAIFVFIYTLIIFFTGKPVEGWTTTMLFLSFGFSGIFLIFAIIIKYLTIILNLIFRRTNYLVESITKLN